MNTSKLRPPVTGSDEMSRVVQAVYDDLNTIVSDGLMAVINPTAKSAYISVLGSGGSSFDPSQYVMASGGRFTGTVEFSLGAWVDPDSSNDYDAKFGGANRGIAVRGLSIFNNDIIAYADGSGTSMAAANYIVNQLTIQGNIITADANDTAQTDSLFNLDGTIKIKFVVGTSGGGTGVWGNITGTLSDQTDLYTALQSKLSATATSDAISEGTSNLYYTDSRAKNAVTGDANWSSINFNASNWDTAYGWGNHAAAGYYKQGDSVVFGSGHFSGALTSDGDIIAYNDGSGSSLPAVNYIVDRLTVQDNLIVKDPDDTATTDVLFAADGTILSKYVPYSSSGGGSWGSISGNLSDQTDLYNALQGKLNSGVNTDAIGEGTSNLYYTDARAAAAVTGNAAWSSSSFHAANWDTAYGWGNHASQGYLTSESDPTVPSHVKTITTGDLSNWDTAYGWGDHSAAGYYKENDNVIFGTGHFTGALSSDGNITAYSDGSGSSMPAANYIVNQLTLQDNLTVKDPANTSSTDTLFATDGTIKSKYVPGGGTAGSLAWGNITGSLSDQTDLYTALQAKMSATATTDALSEGTTNKYYTDARARLAVTGSSSWSSSSFHATNWDTAYGWGNHASEGYLKSETDPTVPSHVKSIASNDISNWNSAYGWGDHAQAGYLTSETDPTVPSVLKTVTSTRVSHWDAAYGWGDHAAAGYAAQSDLSAHVGDTSNPHGVTKAQVGLSNVPNSNNLNAFVNGPGYYKSGDNVDLNSITGRVFYLIEDNDNLMTFSIKFETNSTMRSYFFPRVNGINRYDREFGFAEQTDRWYVDGDYFVGHDLLAGNEVHSAGNVIAYSTSV